MDDRWIEWDGCVNVRELGGLPTGDGGRIRRGSLIRADSMDRLSPTGQTQVATYGVTAFVDLRAPHEGAGKTYPFPWARVSCPIKGADPDGYAAYESLEALSLSIVDNRAPSIVVALRAIVDAPAGPVVIHCAGGKDRTGVISALCLAVAGVAAADIAADYALSGARLRPAFRVNLAAETDPARREMLIRMQPTRPETMASVLRHLDARHGGAETYLLQAGLSRPDLDRLRQRLIEE